MAKARFALTNDVRLFTSWRIWMIVVFVLSVVVYLPSLMGQPVWDDVALLSPNGTADDTPMNAIVHPFLEHYFRPLTSLSLVIDRSYSRNIPFFYHQTNILLHAFTALLVSYLTLLVSERRKAAILAGLFFALQPMQVAAVAWIGGRTDVLSTFFVSGFLVMLVLYHRAAHPRVSQPNRSTRENGHASLWLVGSVAAYLLAALTKEQSAAVFFAVPLSVFAFGTRKASDAFRMSVPFLIALCFYAVLFLTQSSGAMQTDPWSPWSALHAFVLTSTHYAYAIAIPHRASLMIFTLQNYQGGLWFACGLAVLATGCVLLTLTWRANRAVFWLLAVAILVFLPISNIISLPSLWVGPYRISLAGPAIASLLGIGLAMSIDRHRVLLSLAFFANLIAGAQVTWWGLHQWLDPVVLFSDMAQYDPRFVLGKFNYTEALFQARRPTEAIAQADSNLAWIFAREDWSAAITKGSAAHLPPTVRSRLKTDASVKPTAEIVGYILFQRARSHNLSHRSDLALNDLKWALRYAPNAAPINLAMGKQLLDTDRPLGEKYLKLAVSLDPENVPMLLSLAEEEIKDGKYMVAQVLLHKVMLKQPWLGLPWLLSADAKMATGDLQGAKVDLDLAAGKVNLIQSAVQGRYTRWAQLVAQRKR